MYYRPEKKKKTGKEIFVFRYWLWDEISEDYFNALQDAKSKLNSKCKTKIKKINNRHFAYRLKRVPQSEVGKLVTKDNVEEVLVRLTNKYEDKKIKYERALKWELANYKFTKLLMIYKEARVKSAPNCYNDRISFFKNYVLGYFLVKMKLAALSDWANYFNSFKLYLEKEAVLVKDNNRKLSYATKNHCINELNVFLKIIYEKGETGLSIQPKCSLFPQSMVDNFKNESHVVSESEFGMIFEELKLIGHAEGQAEHYANFYKILFYSGCRINEALGIGLKNFKNGSSPQEGLNQLLVEYNQKTYAYLLLMDQPSKKNVTNKNEKKNLNEKVEFKPLKGKSNSYNDCRYIPILDKSTYIILATYYNKHLDLLNQNILGPEKDQYMFFYHLFTADIFRNRLAKAYENLKIPHLYKSPHNLRHSTATRYSFMSKGKLSTELARVILGHASPKMTERYNHSYEIMIKKEHDQKNTPQKIILDDVS